MGSAFALQSEAVVIPSELFFRAPGEGREKHKNTSHRPHAHECSPNWCEFPLHRVRLRRNDARFECDRGSAAKKRLSDALSTHTKRSSGRLHLFPLLITTSKSFTWRHPSACKQGCKRSNCSTNTALRHSNTATPVRSAGATLTRRSPAHPSLPAPTSSCATTHRRLPSHPKLHSTLPLHNGLPSAVSGLARQAHGGTGARTRPGSSEPHILLEALLSPLVHGHRFRV